MNTVPLAAAFPASALPPELPPDATVTSDDLCKLGADLFVYGNVYVRPTGLDAPTHGRVSPAAVTALLTPRDRLKAKKDIVGWRAPWHLHFKTVANGVDRPWDAEQPPLYTVLCSAAECAAEGCPRTESGFPE